MTEGFHVDNCVEPMFGIQVGPAVLTGVHDPAKCAGRPCVIHAPSDHHMRTWPLNWRADKGVMERTCPHGTGHPDPDDLAWNVSEGRDWVGVHGCCGCCRAGMMVETPPTEPQEAQMSNPGPARQFQQVTIKIDVWVDPETADTSAWAVADNVEVSARNAIEAEMKAIEAPDHGVEVVVR